MLFDWDESKNSSNLLKHGRSFREAYLLWANPYGQLLAGNTETESRWVRRGTIGNQIWLCVYTMRDDEYRVMSLRPANAKERDIP
jgi:uncharacterized DUF497 family protein